MSSENENVVKFPRSRETLTPKMLLEEILANVDDIDSVAIVITSKGGETIPVWSQMSAERLCYVLWRFDYDVTSVLTGFKCPCCGEPNA